MTHLSSEWEPTEQERGKQEQQFGGMKGGI